MFRQLCRRGRRDKLQVRRQRGRHVNYQTQTWPQQLWLRLFTCMNSHPSPVLTAPTKRYHPPSLPGDLDTAGAAPGQCQERCGSRRLHGGSALGRANRLSPDRLCRPWPSVAASSAARSAGKAASSGNASAPCPPRQASLSRLPRRTPLGKMKA